MKTSSPRKSLALACGLAVFASPLVFGANDLDSNHDIASKFRKLDGDNDGRISSAEYTSAKPEKKRWWQFGTKPATDQVAHTPEAFRQLDADQDGFLTQAELSNGALLNQTRVEDPALPNNPSPAPDSRTPTTDGTDSSK